VLDLGEVALHAVHAFSCGLTERVQIEWEGEGEREFETFLPTGGSRPSPFRAEITHFRYENLMHCFPFAACPCMLDPGARES
jgi:hypothetical protein